MEVVVGRRYRIAVSFPWGEVRETHTRTLVRERDGTLRWDPGAALGVEAYVDCVIEETDGHVLGWGGGCCDVTVRITAAEGTDGA